MIVYCSITVPHWPFEPHAREVKKRDEEDTYYLLLFDKTRLYSGRKNLLSLRMRILLTLDSTDEEVLWTDRTHTEKRENRLSLHKICYVNINNDITHFVKQTHRKTRVSPTNFMKVPIIGNSNHFFQSIKKRCALNILIEIIIDSQNIKLCIAFCIHWAH